MHKNWRAFIHDDLDQQITPQDRLSLEAHLQNCTECSQYQKQIQQLKQKLRDLPSFTIPKHIRLSISSPPDFDHPSDYNILSIAKKKQFWQKYYTISKVAAVLLLTLGLATIFTVDHYHNKSWDAKQAPSTTIAPSPPTNTNQPPEISDNYPYTLELKKQNDFLSEESHITNAAPSISMPRPELENKQHDTPHTDIAMEMESPNFVQTPQSIPSSPPSYTPVIPPAQPAVPQLAGTSPKNPTQTSSPISNTSSTKQSNAPGAASRRSHQQPTTVAANPPKQMHKIPVPDAAHTPSKTGVTAKQPDPMMATKQPGRQATTGNQQVRSPQTLAPLADSAKSEQNTQSLSPTKSATNGNSPLQQRHLATIAEPKNKGDAKKSFATPFAPSSPVASETKVNTDVVSSPTPRPRIMAPNSNVKVADSHAQQWHCLKQQPMAKQGVFTANLDKKPNETTSDLPEQIQITIRSNCLHQDLMFWQSQFERQPQSAQITQANEKFWLWYWQTQLDKGEANKLLTTSAQRWEWVSCRTANEAAKLEAASTIYREGSKNPSPIPKAKGQPALIQLKVLLGN